MDEETKDVKQEEADPTPVPEEKQQPEPKEETPEEVKKDVENSQGVDRKVYEKVREDMKAERNAKREEQERVRELEERIADLESRDTYADETQSDYKAEPSDYSLADAKAEILFEKERNPFVAEHMEEIYQEMTDKKLTFKDAVGAVSVDFVNRLHKEMKSAEPNKPLKQEKPTATDEEQLKPSLSNDPTANLKAAREGKLEVDPAQLEAIRRYSVTQKQKVKKKWQQAQIN